MIDRIVSLTRGATIVLVLVLAVTGSSSADDRKAWHEVGAPREPAFGANGAETWSNANQSPSWIQYGSVAFYKDPFDVVHLRGRAYFDASVAETGKAAGDTIPPLPIFTLPPGYHPDVAETFPCAAETSDFSSVVTLRCEITADGGVSVPQLYVATFHQWAVALDGITFRILGRSK